MTSTENTSSVENSAKDSNQPLFELTDEEKEAYAKLPQNESSTKQKETKPLSKITNNQMKTIDMSSSPNSDSSKTTPNSKDKTPVSYSLGSYLQEARVKKDYSINQVAMITKLNIHYIEALERDDYKHTPPLIYIKAYVKKLCAVYGINAEKALELLKPIDNNEHNVPDTLVQDLHATKQTNPQDEAKVKFIVKIIIAAASLLILTCIVLGFCFWPSSTPSKPLTAKEKAATIKNMEQLIVPQTISLTSLPVSKQT